MKLRSESWSVLFFFVLTVVHTWPLATDPVHLSRTDNADTPFAAWIIAWIAYQLPRDPLRLFDAPAFLPERDVLAFSDHMFVQGIMGAPLFWLGASPVLVYNLLVFAGHFLSAVAMGYVVTKWTGTRAAGLVAGALFGFNAQLLTRFSHLQALHVEFAPLVFYMLDRVLERRRVRDAILLAVTFVLLSLTHNYWMVIFGAAVLVAVLVRREPFSAGAATVWIRLTVAGAIVVAALLPFVIPYLRVRETHGFVRSIEEAALLAATWRDYLATAGRLHFSLWSAPFIERSALFPGFTAVALVLLTLVTGVAWRDRRARMALAFGLLGVALSFGPALPGFTWLFEHVPPIQGMRATSRWGFLGLTSVAILAGFAMAFLHARWRDRSWWPAIVVAAVGLVTIEALRAPLALHRFDGIPVVHSRLRSDDVSGIVIYPLYSGNAFFLNAHYMLQQTRHWRPMFNGYSSFAPQSWFDRAQRLQRFPDPAVIEELRSIGVSHVVLHREPLERNFGVQAVNSLRAHPELQFVVDQDGVTIYRIRPRTGSD